MLFKDDFYRRRNCIINDLNMDVNSIVFAIVYFLNRGTKRLFEIGNVAVYVTSVQNDSVVNFIFMY